MLHKLTLTLLLLLIILAPQSAVVADIQPVVHAVLFYSPTCGHCHEVIENVLPPLQEEYGIKLKIAMIDVTTEDGGKLYDAYRIKFRSQTNPGVPAMIVGDVAMVGSVEIPEKLEGLITSGLDSGGVPYPDFAGLDEYILAHAQPVESSAAEAELVPTALQPTPEPATTDRSQAVPEFVRLFQRDILANTIAVILLVVMAVTIIWVLFAFLRPVDEEKLPQAPRFTRWIPILSIAGLFVAGYLTYVEVTHVEAVCGPVGDCNSVQQSPYAMLFGFLPVGVFGLLGYIGILLAWLGYRYLRGGLRKAAIFAMWGMAVFGVLFSIYLTFLEPFVIGATCIWCITSAIIITVILWIATPIATYTMAEVTGD